MALDNPFAKLEQEPLILTKEDAGEVKAEDLIPSKPIIQIPEEQLLKDNKSKDESPEPEVEVVPRPQVEQTERVKEKTETQKILDKHGLLSNIPMNSPYWKRRHKPKGR